MTRGMFYYSRSSYQVIAGNFVLKTLLLLARLANLFWDGHGLGLIDNLDKSQGVIVSMSQSVKQSTYNRFTGSMSIVV